MIINTFGCSYTHGISFGLYEEDGPTSLRENWVEKLALRYPEHIFNNYAICNTSLEFSINQLLKVKRTLENIPHVNIFQITVPARITFWDDNTIDKLRYSPLNNLTQYSNKVFKEMQRYNSGWLPLSRIYEKKEFFDHYYRSKSIEQFLNEHLVNIEFIKNNTDFYFFWINQKPEHFPSISGFITDEPYEGLHTREKVKQYTLDDSYHFNAEGNSLVADWVYDSFLKKHF